MYINHSNFKDPSNFNSEMKIAICLGLFILCFSIGCGLSIDDDKLELLSSCLTKLDTVIHQVLALLNSPPSTRPGPEDCTQIFKEGYTKSGIYRIWPLNWQTVGTIKVYCDMETDGGGWTVIQRRGDYGNPVDYFYRSWEEYRVGFGRLDQDFWLGNEKIYRITNQGNYTLRIDMKDKDGEKRYAFYQKFLIESEKQGYRLHVAGFRGDAGDSFSVLNGMKFTTKDVDNDQYTKNCAILYKGAWWYKGCHFANLNGLYHNGHHKSFADGINWHSWKGYYYSLPAVDMKIRKA